MSTGSDVAAAGITVPLRPAAAFDAFATVRDWWPPAFTWSRGVLQDLAIAPHEGGLCSEWGPHGFRVDWGRVLAWEPPERITLAWQIGADRVPTPDPADATTVDVTFGEVPAGTTVEVAHSGFAALGEAGGPYRRAMADEGWPHILRSFAASVGPAGLR